jgi:DNA-binding GntR family transcriptional regulator
LNRLKKLRVGYQILWKKDKKRETWLTKELKKLKPKQMKEYIKEDGYFFKDKTKMKKLSQQHSRILNAIRSRSQEKARERTLEHLDYVDSEVRTFNGSTASARSSE